METGTIKKIDLAASVDTVTRDGFAYPVEPDESTLIRKNNGIFQNGGLTATRRLEYVSPNYSTDNGPVFVWPADDGSIVEFYDADPCLIKKKNGVVVSLPEVKGIPKVRKIFKQPLNVDVIVLDKIKNFYLGWSPNSYKLYRVNPNNTETLLFSFAATPNLKTIKASIVWPDTGEPVYIAILEQLSPVTTGTFGLTRLTIRSATTSWLMYPGGTGVNLTGICVGLKCRNVGTRIMACVTGRNQDQSLATSDNLYLGTFNSGVATRYRGQFVEGSKDAGINDGVYIVTWPSGTGVNDQNMYGTVNKALTTYSLVPFTSLPLAPPPIFADGFSGPGFTFKRMTNHAYSIVLKTSGEGATNGVIIGLINRSVTAMCNFSFSGLVEGAQGFSSTDFVQKFQVNGVCSNRLSFPLFSSNPWTGQDNNAGDDVIYDYKDDVHFETVYQVSDEVVRYGDYFVNVKTGSSEYLPLETPSFFDIGESSMVAPAGLGNATRVISKLTKSYYGTTDTGEQALDWNPSVLGGTAIIGYVSLINGDIFARSLLDVYFNSGYAFTGIAEVVNGGKIGVPYSPELRQSISSVVPVSDLQVLDEEGRTITRAAQYNGFYPENVILGNYSVFKILGQFYLYDNVNIYLVSSNGDIFTSGIQVISPCPGLRYLCQSPETAFFVSSFDNSLFTFNGGRSLEKVINFANTLPILNGVYSLKEASLYLITEGTSGSSSPPECLIVRNGRVSRNTMILPLNGEDVRLRATDEYVAQYGNPLDATPSFGWGAIGIYTFIFDPEEYFSTTNMMERSESLLWETPIYTAGLNNWLKVYKWIFDLDTTDLTQDETITFKIRTWDMDGVLSESTKTLSVQHGRPQYKAIVDVNIDSVSQVALQFSVGKRLLVKNSFMVYTIQGQMQVSLAQRSV
jgi:hypothetical protein